MDVRAYADLLKALADAGLGVQEARHDRQAFGSWFVSIHEPRVRIAWDGKDGWLTLERGSHDGSWRDEWIAREAPDQTVDAVLRALDSTRRS